MYHPWYVVRLKGGVPPYHPIGDVVRQCEPANHDDYSKGYVGEVEEAWNSGKRRAET